MPIANKKQIISWCLFDFANSTYSAVIAAVIFPVYYANHIVGNETGIGDLWWGRAVSLSMITIALTSPVLGGIADFFGMRKRFLFSFTLLCISSVAMLSFLQKGMVIEGFVLVVIANIGMEGGMVFYNSFLPEIAVKEYQGRVSSWGYAVGYAGSILSLMFAMPLVNRGLLNETWLMVSGLFALCSIPAFVYLPPDRRTGRFRDAVSAGMKYTWNTLKKIWKDRESRKFLIAYLMYADGVSTVIVFSSLFAATTLGFKPEELILLYIAVQLTALIGAFVMARPVDFWGPKKVVLISLVLWSAVCVFAFFVTEKIHFWFIASVAGIGLGTVQAASRAFFIQFIPRGHESEYFGVYSMVGKSSSVIGPFLFGYISATMESQRPAILSVTLFFLIGLIIVSFIRAGTPNIKKQSRV
jgi:UMF1 family MFS transporter